MKELASLTKNFKGEITKKFKFKKPRIWREKDILDGKIVDAFVLILRTKGCRWSNKGGCTMCGYFKETYDVKENEILKQIKETVKIYKDEKIVKIFTSGSFLDENEIPSHMQKKIIESFSKAEKIVIESRPEFIKNIENIKSIKSNKRIEIAMGLESASDKVLEYSINKGFKYAEWRKWAEKVKEYGKELKVYILIKPPFLTEKDAIKDAIKSVEKVGDIADTVSFNPVAIHSRTVVEFLWKKNLYRPPWLWSVVEVLKKSSEIYDGMIKCDVVAGGKERGSHNCGKCDKNFLNSIKNFSLKQNADVFENLECICRERWLDLIEVEEFFKG